MKTPKTDADELSSILATGDAKSRRMAAGALGALRDTRAIAPLAARLPKESDLRVVKALIGALGRFPTPLASSALMGLLRSRRPLPDVLAAATKALGAMGEVGLAAALDGLRDGPPVADRAARVLGLTGSPAAAPVLAALLRGASAKSTHLAAAEALAQSATIPPEAAEALADLLGDEGAAVWAAEALARIGPTARGAVAAAATRGGEAAVRAARLLTRWP